MIDITINKKKNRSDLTVAPLAAERRGGNTILVWSALATWTTCAEIFNMLLLLEIRFVKLTEHSKNSSVKSEGRMEHPQQNIHLVLNQRYIAPPPPPPLYPPPPPHLFPEQPPPPPGLEFRIADRAWFGLERNILWFAFDMQNWKFAKHTGVLWEAQFLSQLISPFRKKCEASSPLKTISTIASANIFIAITYFLLLLLLFPPYI